MFRKMRRFRQELSQEETVAILERGSSGVLAVSGDDGYPYAVPLSYVFADGKIIFHCAKQGHKLDAIRNNDKVSFCVVDRDDVKAQEYTTYFASVIVFGRARIVEDDGEKRAAICTLAEKYRPGHEEERAAAVDREFGGMSIVEIQIEHMTGKEAIELTKRR
ncbi:MAG: pyridoxamine 5'-phosphate oxidase family protein [Ruminococcaceae bacterium]|nr:pyridoxamine 5'-phosphate oxidase family protein [Oscillospiraceae bacterium]